jgi:hypothetical protein
MDESVSNRRGFLLRLLRGTIATQQFGLVVVIVALGATVAVLAGNETVLAQQTLADGSVAAVQVTHNRLLNA